MHTTTQGFSPSEKIFALVDDTGIVLFPLTEADIYSRNQPNENYYPCFRNVTPEYNPFYQYLIDKPVIVGNYVIVNYEIATIPIEHLFNELIALRDSVGPEFNITHVPMTLLASFDAAVTYKVTEMLNTWARTRRYDDIGSLVDYRDDPVEKFRNEGLRGQYIRSTTWFQLTNYLAGIVAGTIPMPMSWAEIEAVLPPINWGDL